MVAQALPGLSEPMPLGVLRVLQVPAGTFFQASLLPYIGFLFFLGYAPNNTPKQALFGFQFLLLFVLSTVFNGVVFGGLIVGVVALVRKRRKGKG